MNICSCLDLAQSAWDKEFKKGEELFRQGSMEPDAPAQSHGWQCAKAMKDLRSKYLQESRELAPKRVWAIQLGDVGLLMYGHGHKQEFVCLADAKSAEVFPSFEKAEAHRVENCSTLWGDRSKVVEVEV